MLSHDFTNFLAANGLIDPVTGARLERFVFCSDGPFDVRDFVVKQCYISKVRCRSLLLSQCGPPSSVMIAPLILNGTNTIPIELKPFSFLDPVPKLFPRRRFLAFSDWSRRSLYQSSCAVTSWISARL